MRSKGHVAANMVQLPNEAATRGPTFLACYIMAGNLVYYIKPTPRFEIVP